jgi:hypothetical protein
MMMMMMLDVLPLWRTDVPYPANSDLRFPAGVEHSLVHRAGGDTYGFLHDSAIVAHKGALFAAWYNCPAGEIVGESIIRGQRDVQIRRPAILQSADRGQERLGGIQHHKGKGGRDENYPWRR